MPYSEYHDGQELKLDARETRAGGEPEDPGDRWTTYTPEHVDVSFVEIYRDVAAHQGYDSHHITASGIIDANAVSVHLVVTRYTTGGTFSTTYGTWTVSDVFADIQDAEALKNALLAGYNTTAPDREYSITHNGIEYSLVAKGYFERLESIDIITVPIR